MMGKVCLTNVNDCGKTTINRRGEASGMDEKDEQILAILSQDGRAPLEDVAKRVGMRRPSVHERVRRLRESGVLTGFHAVLRPEDVGGSLCAFVFLELGTDGRDCLTTCDAVSKRLAMVPNVLEVHTVAGAQDLLVKLRARDLRHLEQTVLKELSGITGVRRVVTHMVLRTHFERPLRPAPAPSGARPARRR